MHGGRRVPPLTVAPPDQGRTIFHVEEVRAERRCAGTRPGDAGGLGSSHMRLVPPRWTSRPSAMGLTGQLKKTWIRSLALRHLHLSKLPAARDLPPPPDCHALASKTPSEWTRPAQASTLGLFPAAETALAPDKEERGWTLTWSRLYIGSLPHVYPRCSTTCVCGLLRPCRPHREVPTRLQPRRLPVPPSPVSCGSSSSSKQQKQPVPANHRPSRPS